ncbi:MAG: hypothetical protein H0T62_13430 [Parachlamydiaceae bacterium]|nr:hypothetical protein [Parachlamydiaceae bacterium]
MYTLAKWIDTQYFPDTKKAFFKERKNGEIAICYRGRCWSYLCSWSIGSRGDRYDLNKIFELDESSLDQKLFLQNAKKFIRSPESEQYFNDALQIFNRFRGSFFVDHFANPTKFSEILQLSNYFINEPIPIKPEDEIFADYYNLVFKQGVIVEKIIFKNFLMNCEYQNLLYSNERTSNIKPKDLIDHTSYICELSSDWKEASNNLRPILRNDLDGSLRFHQSVASKSIYDIAKATYNFRNKKPSNHFSRIYIDSIFSLKRDITKTFEPANIIDTFTLLQGKESSPLEEISKRISTCSQVLFREPIPEHLLTLFSDTDTFFEKVKFLGSFFVETHSFMGCIDQDMDVLSRLRTEGDKLGKTKFKAYYLIPCMDKDFENIIINFITKNYKQFTLLEKFDILKLFTNYHPVVKNSSILHLFLAFLQNFSRTTSDIYEIQFSIHWIAECLKNAKLSKNLLKNLNPDNAIFSAFLKHFFFSKNSVILPLFAASTLPFNLDWDRINKIISDIPSGTKFGSLEKMEKNFAKNSESLEEGDTDVESDSWTDDSDSWSWAEDSEKYKAFQMLIQKTKSEDLYLSDFIASTAMKVTNEKELLTLLFYISHIKYLNTELLICTKPLFQEEGLKSLVKNIKSINEVAAHRLPQTLQQIQTLLGFFNSQNMSEYKSKNSVLLISDLLVRLDKIPKSYQLITSKIIEKVRNSYSNIEHCLFVNRIKNGWGKDIEEKREKLPEKIHHINHWSESRVHALLEALHFGAIFRPRLNEDVLLLILENLINLRAHEALQIDQTRSKSLHHESSSDSSSDSSSYSSSGSSSNSSTEFLSESES